MAYNTSSDEASIKGLATIKYDTYQYLSMMSIRIYRIKSRKHIKEVVSIQNLKNIRLALNPQACCLFVHLSTNQIILQTHRDVTDVSTNFVKLRTLKKKTIQSKCALNADHINEFFRKTNVAILARISLSKNSLSLNMIPSLRTFYQKFYCTFISLRFKVILL